MKRCCTCGSEKPLSKFNKYSLSPDGHQPRCADCQKIGNDRTYPISNPLRPIVARLQRENPDWTRKQCWAEARRQSSNQQTAPAAPKQPLWDDTYCWPKPSRAAGKTGKNTNKREGPGRGYVIFPSWLPGWCVMGATEHFKRRETSYKFPPLPRVRVHSKEKPRKFEFEKQLHARFAKFRVGNTEWFQGVDRAEVEAFFAGAV